MSQTPKGLIGDGDIMGIILIFLELDMSLWCFSTTHGCIQEITSIASIEVGVYSPNKVSHITSLCSKIFSCLYSFIYFSFHEILHYMVIHYTKVEEGS